MWNDDYKEMLLLLLKENVEFLIVGAYALAAHGYPRATLDIDIWVNPTIENATRVHRALTKFGAPMDTVKISDFSSTDTIFQIGVAPRRIDILTDISGVEFCDAISKALTSEFDDITLNVLSIDHLIKNKLATGRDKDIVDVNMLKKR